MPVPKPEDHGFKEGSPQAEAITQAIAAAMALITVLRGNPTTSRELAASEFVAAVANASAVAGRDETTKAVRRMTREWVGLDDPRYNDFRVSAEAALNGEVSVPDSPLSAAIQDARRREADDRHIDAVPGKIQPGQGRKFTSGRGRAR